MSLEYLISHYGYAAIAIGTFFEGETILIIGGFSAHSGYLHLQGVIASALIGSFFGDQLFYHLGRIKGKNWLENKPHWKAKTNRVNSLLVRHQTLLIIGFRFIYGLRTITPIIIGVSGISAIRFFILNFIGAFLWASLVGSLGYLFGQSIQILIGDIKKYELIIFVALALTGLLVWIFRFLTKDHRDKPPAG